MTIWFDRKWTHNGKETDLRAVGLEPANHRDQCDEDDDSLPDLIRSSSSSSSDSEAVIQRPNASTRS